MELSGDTSYFVNWESYLIPIPKYKSPLKGDGNHAALATGFSHLAITFATDLVDHRNGWACSFHSATKAIKPTFKG
jgi:hypothetical protein